MALNDDAVKAAAEALSEYYEGDGWGYFGGAAEAAVAAAAPILLAARTLGLIGAPRTGEPLSESEQRRFEEAVVRGLQHRRADVLAAERARIAAAIRAAGHPDGYHRVDTTREWAGIYCADCAVTERSARIAETAPEEGS